MKINFLTRICFSTLSLCLFWPSLTEPSGHHDNQYLSPRSTANTSLNLPGLIFDIHNIEILVNYVEEQLSELGNLLDIPPKKIGQSRVYRPFLEDFSNNFRTIISLIQRGKINPKLVEHMMVRDEEVPPPNGISNEQPIKVGYFASAGNPFHMSHILTMLDGIKQFELDQMLTIISGDDIRKDGLASFDLRWQWGSIIEKISGGLIKASDVNKLRPSDVKSNKSLTRFQNPGENNIFLDLARNREIPIQAIYFVGSDHFNWKVNNSKQGVIPDTLKYFYDNFHNPNLNFNSKKHSITIAFIARTPQEINFQKVIEQILEDNEVIEASKESLRSALNSNNDEQKAALENFLGYKLKIINPSHSYSSTRIRAGLSGIDEFGVPLNIEQIRKNISHIDPETLKDIIYTAIVLDEDPYNIKSNTKLIEFLFDQFINDKMSDTNREWFLKTFGAVHTGIIIEKSSLPNSSS